MRGADAGADRHHHAPDAELLRASRAACSGAAPPKAISVRSAVSLPFSTAWTRAALAMVSSTISAMPRRGLCGSGSIAAPARPPARVRVQRDPAAGEARRVESGRAAGRHRSPSAPRRRARSRPGPARCRRCPAPPDAAERVDAGDRAAAGADLHHVDHRDAHRQAAALDEAIGARDLEMPAALQRSGHRSALIFAVVPPMSKATARAMPFSAATSERQDGAARRAALHQAHREAPRGLDRGDAAGGHHQQQRRGEARLRAARPPAGRGSGSISGST